MTATQLKMETVFTRRNLHIRWVEAPFTKRENSGVFNDGN